MTNTLSCQIIEYFTQLPDLGVTAYHNIVLVASLTEYFGGSSDTSIEDRRNYGPAEVSESQFEHHVYNWKHFIADTDSQYGLQDSSAVDDLLYLR